MPDDFLSTPVMYLKGVGPQRADALKEQIGIGTFGDLIQHFPFRYIDRSRFYTIRELKPGPALVQVKGVVTWIDTVKQKRGRRLTAGFEDDTGSVELVWFNALRWISEKLKVNQRYVLFGRPELYKEKINFVHPELETEEDFIRMPASVLQPIYSSTEKLKARGLDARGIWKLQKTLLPLAAGKIPETLSAPLIRKYEFLPREKALESIHLPSDAGSLRRAQERLKFEELFFIQLRLLKIKAGRRAGRRSIAFGKVGDLFNRFYRDILPFPLTGAQKKVMREIRRDVGTEHQMNRLLQGDVGSGKTLVALMTALIAMDNGCQAALMAPTEILATQHFRTMQKLLGKLPVRKGLLTGSTGTRDRRELLKAADDGSLHLLAGTHALLEERVSFHRLGLVIIDEQHRFGVEQRARLWNKGPGAPPPLREGQGGAAPHVMVMTATPIPRTLAMTLYGDLDVSVIDELPPGRKPVKTVHRFESSRLAVYGFLKKQIALGRQAYIVYPLIGESEKLDYANLESGYESIVSEFPAPNYRVCIVHGRMKPEERALEMQRFISGKADIMVATTVIEVGVDIPNASVMVIESAERFGLSQLHQLRGRVGRGADQSYCILMSAQDISDVAGTRLKTMVATTDGFRIAEADLKLRGPGDLEGTQQSGVLDLKIADLATDIGILQHARTAAQGILEKDPLLSLPENRPVKLQLEAIERLRPDWSRVG